MRSRVVFIALGALLLIAIVWPREQPEDLASEFCQEQIAATFDDPTQVTFVDWVNPNYRPDRHYVFEGTAEADGHTFDVECDVVGDPGSFRLASSDITPRG